MKSTPAPVLPDADIRRLILNQKKEHSPHAFRAGGAGMADFRRLATAFAALPPERLAGWLELIEQVAETHAGCLPCAAKIRAYLLVFSRERLPDVHTRHEREYRRLALAGRRMGRDYLGEVLDSLQGNDDSPAAAANRQWWRSLAEELAEARALGLPSPLQP
jgi:hypothetical protein